TMRIVAGTNAPRLQTNPQGRNYGNPFGPGYGGGYGGYGPYPGFRGPERRVIQAFVYPGYVKAKSSNDIALLRLDQPLPLFPFSKINTICLPAQGEEAAGPLATASGWGQTAEKGRQSLFLKSVNVTIVPDR